MEFKVTVTFSKRYDALSDDDAVAIDYSLERLRHAHETSWARQNRVTGDGTGHWDSAWVIRLMAGVKVFHLYWQYFSEREIVLLGLAEIGD